MTPSQKSSLLTLARSVISNADPSHDMLHALRVLKLVERIGEAESANLDVLIPAALFHDAISYPKNDPRSKLSSIESGELVTKILEELVWYPKELIPKVSAAITKCSFTKNLPKDNIEEYILQDADMMEVLGALGVARIFSSGGQMSRAFYDETNPTGEGREVGINNLDMFSTRLMAAANRLHTKTAQEIGKSRLEFLKTFKKQFIEEIS